MNKHAQILVQTPPTVHVVTQIISIPSLHHHSGVVPVSECLYCFMSSRVEEARIHSSFEYLLSFASRTYNRSTLTESYRFAMAQSEGLPLLQQPTSPRAKVQDQERRKHQTRRRIFIGLAITTLVVAVGLVSSRDPTWADPLLPSSLSTGSKYAAVLNKYRETTNFDGVVQVRVNGRVVFEEADGLADEEFDVPMATNSIFPVGSNSKLFVSVSLYQLQERGLVNLSDPVNQYLTQDDFTSFGFPNQSTWCPRVAGASIDSPCENVTFVQLLFMGSGIGDSLNCDNVDAAHCYRTAENLAYYKGSLAPYIGMFINDPLVFKPGTNYSYSSPNYYLLSYLVEKISGERLENYIKTHITDKIGLKDTHYDPYSGVLGVRRGYVQQYTHFYAQPSPDVKGELLATGTCSPYVNSGAISGSGGFRSTTSDMHRWYLDLFDNHGTASKVLTAASIRMIIERVNPAFSVYAQGVGVGPLGADGWPTAVAYCGGMKCCTTCLELIFPQNSSDSSVLMSSFSNHNHAIFPDRAAFEQFRPHEFMSVDVEPGMVKDLGGADTLRNGLVRAYLSAV